MILVTVTTSPPPYKRTIPQYIIKELIFPFSTPPSRTTAFDIFKSEKGTELNRILVENKDILAANKKSYSDLARGINGIKVEIDQCRMLLEKLKDKRESNGMFIRLGITFLIIDQKF